MWMVYSVILVETGSLAKGTAATFGSDPSNYARFLEYLKGQKILYVTTSQKRIKILSLAPLPLFLELWLIEWRL
jgi:hypothetical protein